MPYVTAASLATSLEHIRQAPRDHGRIELLVRRPAVDERDVVAEAVLDLCDGLVGDNWRVRGSTRTPDGSANPEAQLTVMNARVAALVAGAEDRWPLAGDQIYADMDLSLENLPPGTQLRLGSAVVEVSSHPHTGCAKFAARFGQEAVRFVNSPAGRALRLRGMNAKVVVPGTVRVGDAVVKCGLPGISVSAAAGAALPLVVG